MWLRTTLLVFLHSLVVFVSGDVVLVQWGRRDCEGRGAELVYSGLMAGPAKTAGVKSSVNKHLCLPNNPTYGRFDAGKQQRYTQIFRVEYSVDGRSDILGSSRAKNDGIDQSKDFNGNAVPCAVCLFFRTSTQVVIPGKYSCPYNWRTAYSGYLMASAPSSGDPYYRPYRKKRQTTFGESADPPPGTEDSIPTPAFPDFPDFPDFPPLPGSGADPPAGGNSDAPPPPLPPVGFNPPVPGASGNGNPPAGFNPLMGAGNGQGVPWNPSGFPAPSGFPGPSGFPAPSGPPTTARPLDPRFVQMCGTWYDYWYSMQKMYEFSSYPSYPSYPSYQTYPSYGAGVPDYGSPGVGTVPDYNPGVATAPDYNPDYGTNDGSAAAVGGNPGDAGFSDIGFSTDVGTSAASGSRMGRQAPWPPQTGFRQVATTAPLDDREKFVQSCATYYEAAEKMKKLFEANNPGINTYPSRPAQAEQNEGFDEPRVETSRELPLKTDYVCVAGSPEVHALGKQNAGIAAKITPVEASCNDLPCPSYREGRELQCVVCVR